MADPIKYQVSYSFSGWQAVNPSEPLPAQRIDIEFADIAQSISQTIEALKDIRRSDGKLKNKSVTLDAMADDAKITLSGGSIDAWAPVVEYEAGISATPDAPATVVTYGGSTWLCQVAHVTTATFEAANWIEIAARGQNGTGTGDLLAANNLSDVDSIEQARSNLQAAAGVHTHTVDQIANLEQGLIDALGYAPAKVNETVNKAGDTMTGPLYVEGEIATVKEISNGANFFSPRVTAKIGNQPYKTFFETIHVPGSHTEGHFVHGVEGDFNVWVFKSTGEFFSPNTIYVGGSKLYTDGNLSGSKWLEWGSQYASEAIYNQIGAQVSTRAAAGAECRHNSGIYEAGAIHTNFMGSQESSTFDLPDPYVMTGLRSRAPSASGEAAEYIYIRAKTLRNQ